MRHADRLLAAAAMISLLARLDRPGSTRRLAGDRRVMREPPTRHRMEDDRTEDDEHAG
jgi:hypothetical protein